MIHRMAEDQDDLDERPEFGRWLLAEMRRLNDEEEARGVRMTIRTKWGPQRVANEAIDPRTGEKPFSRVTISGYLTKRMERDLNPYAYRALANVFGVEPSVIRDVVAIDLDCADASPRDVRPPWVPTAAVRLSPQRRNLLREVIDLALEAEGLK